MFGLYPRRVSSPPASDADIVIYDPAGRTEIGFGKAHHMNMDHSAWEGTVIDGKVDTVISRGSVVIDDNTFTGRRPRQVRETWPVRVPGVSPTARLKV